MKNQHLVTPPNQMTVKKGMASKIIPVAPFDLVVFGGTGDLALRKLMPSLYYRELDHQLPEDGRVIGVARGDFDRDSYVEMIKKGCREHIKDKDDFNNETWEKFAKRLYFLAIDVTKTDDYLPLVDLLSGREDRVRVFYLSTSPELFGPSCEQLAFHQLITPMARVVLEKPLGHNLETAQRINDKVGHFFPEDQVYRIDHYLGKETVQNLMALRFANTLFEPLWNHRWIDHVQITVAESIGIEGRSGYYDRAGALRDMVQNHLLQLLCLVSMEPPSAFSANGVRDEKLKILRALRPISSETIKTTSVIGSYAKGAVGGLPVPGYHEEEGVPEDSETETFVALKAEVDNWRWSGVPFYLRTGKRMPQRISEIAINFREIPHLIFPKNADQVTQNSLVIRLQPDEGIKLYLMAKVPGPGGFRMQPVALNLSFAETFKSRFPGGYERLLMDVVRGNQTLFMRRDEVEAAWGWVEPILEAWQEVGMRPKTYTAGTWGPSASIALIERDNRTWFEEH